MNVIALISLLKPVLDCKATDVGVDLAYSLLTDQRIRGVKTLLNLRSCQDLFVTAELLWLVELRKCKNREEKRGAYRP